MLVSNRISLQLEEYLKYKRSLGYKLVSEESILRSLVSYTLNLGYDGPFTKEIALSWINYQKDAPNKRKGRKLQVLLLFARYVVSFDNEAEMLPSKMFGNPHERIVPYIYSEEEVVRLMDECKRLYSIDGWRSLTIATAIGLLWATGLRTSELTNLRIKDVDLCNNLLYVWASKFKKDRIVPISISTAKELSKYKMMIEKRLGERHEESSFFITDRGKPLTLRAFSYAFKLIRGCIGANPIGHPAVRLTDFRHTFASRTIFNWLEKGIDVNANIFQLSVFLGHAKVQDTYWYLSATPEMLSLTNHFYERQFGGGYDE